MTVLCCFSALVVELRVCVDSEEGGRRAVLIVYPVCRSGFMFNPHENVIDIAMFDLFCICNLNCPGLKSRSVIKCKESSESSLRNDTL